jgi:D-serine deaminase-like pyridoxal phosphate-dependent protein
VTHISEIDTPAILIDVERMERNLSRVAEYARSQGLRLRPHTKT